MIGPVVSGATGNPTMKIGDASLSSPGEALKMTAPDLLARGIIDEIVAEPSGGAHTNPSAAATLLDAVLSRALADIGALTSAERLERRYQKFRAMGRLGDAFTDAAATGE